MFLKPALSTDSVVCHLNLVAFGLLTNSVSSFQEDDHNLVFAYIAGLFLFLYF